MIYLNIARNATQKPKVGDVFKGFEHFWPSFKITFLIGLYTLLWSLLFVIPGIIKGFSYSQAMYIIADNPNMRARDAIRLSSQMMDGHKMDLFILQLSFIGWAILGVFTLGLLYIWLEPYMQATYTNFYLSLKQPIVPPVYNAPNFNTEQTPQ